jgi:hypothetical protein
MTGVPMGSLPHRPTRLEQLAARAGMTADELRDYLYEQLERAEAKWRAELAAALAGEPERVSANPEP